MTGSWSVNLAGMETQAAARELARYRGQQVSLECRRRDRTVTVEGRLRAVVTPELTGPADVLVVVRAERQYRAVPVRRVLTVSNRPWGPSGA